MLHKIRLIPGLDKQSSDTGAEGKWVNADYTRFRYGFPEKIGGWEQLVIILWSELAVINIPGSI